jgi:hypothetical protein
MSLLSVLSENTFDGSAHLLIRAYSQALVKFNDEPHRRVWAYSLKAKDQTIFDLLSEMLEWPYTLRYGEGLTAESISTLDWTTTSGNIATLDEGYTLDMDSYAMIPIFVFQMRYAIDKEYFPLMDGYTSVLEKMSREAEFISLIKPVRTFCILVGYPSLVMRRVTTSPDMYAYGLFVHGGPTVDDGQWEEIDGLSDAELQEFYKVVTANLPIVFSMLQDNDRKKVFRIEQGRKLDNFEVISGNSRFSDFVVEVNWAELIWPADIAFSSIELTIDFRNPGNPDYVVIDGRKADTPDSDYTEEWDGGNAFTPEEHYLRDLDGGEAVYGR